MNLLVIIIRILFPLLILISPFLGGFIAIYLDGWDWHNRNLLQMATFGEYQQVDKILDLFYLSLFAFVAFHFKNRLVRQVLFILFLYRVLGVVLFEVTDMKWFLFVFPNLFENFFIFYYFFKLIAGYEPKISYVTLLFFLSMIGIPKIFEEYLMHVIEKKTFFIHGGVIQFVYQLPEYAILFLFSFSVICGLFYRLKKKK